MHFRYLIVSGHSQALLALLGLPDLPVDSLEHVRIAFGSHHCFGVPAGTSLIQDKWHFNSEIYDAIDRFCGLKRISTISLICQSTRPYREKEAFKNMMARKHKDAASWPRGRQIKLEMQCNHRPFSIYTMLTGEQ